MTALAAADRFAAHYAALKAAQHGAGPAWLGRLRETAFEGFAAAGLPTPRIEAWKYTNLAPLAKLALVPATAVKNGVKPAALPWLLPESAQAHRLVFVNGRLRADLSAPGKLPQGVVLRSLAAVLADEPALLADRLGTLGAVERQPMLALNMALMADGFVLRLPPGVELARPVELLFVSRAGSEPVACHPRGIVLAGPGSSASVIEQHVGLGAGPSFANIALEVVLEEGAALRHYKLEAESAEAFHVATAELSLGRAASYESFVLAEGGRLARNELRVRLAGAGSSCRLDGAYMARGRQHIDNTIFVDHAGERTTSRESYKGVLDGNARGVFQGHILVRPGAQKTDGQQSSRALLLSPGAEVDYKPQLEIYADDVKCGHGAAAGELDEEALFYLRSRGIPETAARHMLVEAFLGEVVDRLADPAVREGFRGRVSAWMGA